MLDVYVRENVICAEGTIESIGQKVFVYAIDGMLIDSGPENLKKELISFYKKEPFDLVALTHSHEDHTGTAAWIQDNLHVPLYIHEKGISICKEPGSYPKYRQITWGGREAFKAQPLEETVRSRTLEWQVLYTPGHSEDHVAFYNKDTGILFSGDLYVSPKTKVSMKNESVPQIMDSIRLLLALDFKHLFCSHAGFVDNGREMLEKKIGFLEKLSNDVKSLHADGLSIKEIDQKLFTGTYPIVGFSDREWDSVHLVRSILKNTIAIQKR